MIYILQYPFNLFSSRSGALGILERGCLKHILKQKKPPNRPKMWSIKVKSRQPFLPRAILRTNNDRMKTTELFLLPSVFSNIPISNVTFAQHTVPRLKSYPVKSHLVHRRYAPTAPMASEEISNFKSCNSQKTPLSLFFFEVMQQLHLPTGRWRNSGSTVVHHGTSQCSSNHECTKQDSLCSVPVFPVLGFGSRA